MYLPVFAIENESGVARNVQIFHPSILAYLRACLNNRTVKINSLPFASKETEF